MDTIHVVQISGGKDSQACAKLIRERNPDAKIVGLFCDTGFEHPWTYKHVQHIAELYRLELVTLQAGTVAGEVTRWKRFPGGGARHCTEYLKIKPAKDWLIKEAIRTGEQIINYIGVRSDESAERRIRYKDADTSLVMPHDFMPSKYPKYMGVKLGIRYCTPIIDWSTEDVFSYLEGEENPLYAAGFDRVGCFPCLAGGDKAKGKAFGFDATGAKHCRIAKELERITVAAGNRALFTTNVGKRIACKLNEIDESGAGCAFCAI